MSKKQITTGQQERHLPLKLHHILLVLCLILPYSGLSQDVLPADDPLYDDARSILSNYISYPSVSGNEKEAGEFLANLCIQKGLTVRLFTDEVDSYNFSASLYPLDKKKPNIILLSHIDVVNEGDPDMWKHPAFSGEIDGDTIWGRGTIDMKGNAVMHLLALSSLKDRAVEEDLPFNVSLLCVSGEEVHGIKGAKIITDNFLDELNPAVVFGEGGIGNTGELPGLDDLLVFFISLNDKRSAWIKLDLHYETSGHGAVPPPEYTNKLMINALSGLTKKDARISFHRDARTMLRSYGRLRKGIPGFILKNPVIFRPLVTTGLKKNHLMLSTVTNTTTITGIFNPDTDINQIPQEITVLLDCRLLPCTSTQDFMSLLEKKLGNDLIEITLIEETRNATTTVPDSFYRLFCDALGEIYPGSEVIPVMFPATTDNNYFRNKGIPVFGIIPSVLDRGLLETIHNYDERIPVEAVVSGTRVYMRFLEKVLFGEEPAL